MPIDARTPETPDLLGVLRQATGPSHERLDAAFGALDLQKREDLARFLRAHAIGLAPLFPRFRRFIEDVLGQPCPDYPAMLQTDLAALGDDAAAVPATPEASASVVAAVNAPGAGPGVGYVVTGSRLGLTVLRQRGYWGDAEGFRSSYMEDGVGHSAWKALVPWMKAHRAAPEEAEAVRAAALAAFDTFADAFARSGPEEGGPAHEAHV